MPAQVVMELEEFSLSQDFPFRQELRGQLGVTLSWQSVSSVMILNFLSEEE